jgi:CBS domain containing-hemolysin-like protein
MPDDSSTSSKPSWLKRLKKALSRTGGADGASVDPADLIREREEAGEALPPPQRDMILKVARFDRLRVSDVMVPRSDIVAVDASDTLEEVAAVFAETQHSRLPVLQGGLDDPVGMVHVKDVMALIVPGPDGAAKAKMNERVLLRIKRDVLCVPPSMQLTELLLRMRTQRKHLALVIDEYGGTEGLATIEDLMEQIVGDIDDEHDDDEPPQVTARGAGRWDADAATEIADFTEETGVDLTLEEREDEIDTLGGLVVALARRVPVRGEIVRHPSGFDLEVLEADPRRVKRLRVARIDAAPSEDAGHA